jgi:hypothetical protein
MDFRPFSAKPPAITEQLGMHIYGWTPLERQLQFDVNMAAPNRPLNANVVYPERPAEFGLLQVDHGGDRENYWGAKKDIFLDRDDSGRIVNYINCTLPGESPNPVCVLYMRLGVADLSVLFSRILLPKWKIISRKARAFFQCGLEES